MNASTLSYRPPRFSRIKALIGAGLATLAIAGAVQASIPVSASAMPREKTCWDIYNAAVDAFYKGEVFEYLILMELYDANNCDGVITGL